MSSIADALFICVLAERDSFAAINALSASAENGFTDDNVFLDRHLLEGLVARMTKDDGKARAAFIAALPQREKDVRNRPDDAGALCALGLIDAGLGRKEEALREGRRAVELLPIQKDAYNGPRILMYSAIIAAWVGEEDLACEQLATAIRQPSPVSYGALKLLPWWDPVRGYPRFEMIVASLAPR